MADSFGGAEMIEVDSLSLPIGLCFAAVVLAPLRGTVVDRLLRLRDTGRRRPVLPVRAKLSSKVDSTAKYGCLAVCVALLTIAFVGWPFGFVLAFPAGLAVSFICRRVRRRRACASCPGSGLRMAATWDLLAAGLSAGLPVATAVRAAADDAPDAASAALRSTADLLALGASVEEAWRTAAECSHTAELARAAGRSARSGSALACTASELAEKVRADVAESAEARSQRAAVLITGPLGLCFLPAFLCLGVVPVVFGLASQLAIVR